MFKILFIYIFFYLNFILYANISDDLIVKQIADILIKEYDNFKDRSFLEKIVLKLGKTTFIESIKIWEKNYNNIDNIEIKLQKQIQNIVDIGNKYLNEHDSITFKNLFINLTKIGYKNFDIYFRSLKNYIANKNIENITIIDIDNSVNQPIYFEERKQLYKEEIEIKNKIREYFKKDEIKYHISFYSFAFNFFDKIRTRIIENDFQKIEKKLKEQNSNTTSP